MKSKLSELFYNQELKSTKYLTYLDTYEQLFEPFKEKKITFVEIGAKNGGSLMMWKNYFSKESRIIGIDLNSKAKILEKNGLEIFIGDQSDENFWKNFFSKVGPVDIVLDDGGHINIDQIVTCEMCIPNINDGGILLTEDVSTSYMKRFSNPSKYSFINYSKKKIDDINFRFPNIGNLKNSLNKYIHSIEFFESIVCFKINRKKCFINEGITNSGKDLDIEDLRFGEQKTMIRLRKNFSFLRNIRLFKYISIKIVSLTNRFSIFSKNLRSKKFFN